MSLPLQKPLDETDGRRFQRVPVALFGRYMLESKSEVPLSNRGDVARRHAAFRAGKAGDRRKGGGVSRRIGRFAGNTVRLDSTGFAITMNLPLMKREKLADQLTWFASRNAIGLPEDRRHKRITPLMRRAILRLEDSREIIVKILDLSISGVGVETEVPPPLGANIVLGSTPAAVVRHFEKGFAAEFAKPFAPGAIDELTRL